MSKQDYSNPAMEAEFGIILNRDLKPELISFEYILESIESIYPLIEIHNLVFYGDAPHGAELLANNAVHAGVILGPENKFPKSNQSTDLKLIYDKAYHKKGKKYLKMSFGKVKVSLNNKREN